LQRAGHLGKARRHFQSAVNLNSVNIAASENLKLNDDLQAGHKLKVRTPRSFDDDLGRFRNLQRTLPETGPFDDPTYCFGQGVIFAQNNLLRQATQQFERVRELVPDNLQVRILLARLYVIAGLPEKSYQLMEG